MKKNNSILNISINAILFVILVLLLLSYFGFIGVFYKESFIANINNNRQLMPGEYPLTATQPLLYGDYKVKQNTNVTKNNNYNIWKSYPVFPSSYKQQTNNIRYWDTPDNGLCSPAEFCGTPYEKTKIKKSAVSKAVPIESNVTRVNWWAAKYC
jgi:hypothetical protein